MNNFEGFFDTEPVTRDPFRDKSLAALKTQLASAHYPGYPTKRLVMLAWYLDAKGPDTRLTLPSGQWELNSEELPSASEQQEFLNQGLGLDTCGRPVHPWIGGMLFDRDIGVITGKGFYWQWGPNYTADPIVTRRTGTSTEVLLIQRGDTGRWALPGGFVNSGENPFDSAIREAAEETGLDISAAAKNARAIYDGPLSDIRVTANAWPYTYAFHFDVTGLDLGVPSGQDDAIDAAWLSLNDLPGVLFGSHALLIQKALE